jgi:hypothetical protein
MLVRHELTDGLVAGLGRRSRRTRRPECLQRGLRALAIDVVFLRNLNDAAAYYAG